MPNQLRAINVVGKIMTRKTANLGPLDAIVAERRAIYRLGVQVSTKEE